MGAAIAILGMFVLSSSGIIALAFRALSAENRAGENAKAAAEQSARADNLSINLTERAARLHEVTEELKETKERLDEVAALAVQYAANQPASGAFARLLQRLGVPGVTAGDRGNDPVLHGDSTSGDDPERLFRPGE